jgi:acetate kinase
MTSLLAVMPALPASSSRRILPLERVGQAGTRLTFRNDREAREGSIAAEPAATEEFLIGWLEEQVSFDTLAAVGHRVVHGMLHTDPALVTAESLEGLRRISAYDPEHLPAELRLIEFLRARHPELNQFACFDTAFHATMPRVARLLPIPRRFDAGGIQRYGLAISWKSWRASPAYRQRTGA